MLYQWDVKKWLSLPFYKVKTDVFITAEKHKIIVLPNKTISFEAGVNSFDIHVQYLSPDNMPRYTRAAFIKVGDTVLLPEPSLQSIYNIKNTASGNYSFVLDVFEMDGSTSRYTYKIIIKKFLWQQWWFWALLSALFFGVIAYLVNQKRKRELAEQQALTKEAELSAYRSEQEKKIVGLKLQTLSSQFRPHFILNALNTIGAQMEDRPSAESVLSRLGESVNLIFNHTQHQRITHQFEYEWKLVTNVIHIHQLMYLKNLEVKWPDEKVLEIMKDVPVPMGLLQIPVENALLHGLSNREQGPWQLTISIEAGAEDYTVLITDNGVGRKQSALLSNFTKHGTGSKNLAEILSMVNFDNQRLITLTYEDDIFETNGSFYGTRVVICIPKKFKYGYT